MKIGKGTQRRGFMSFAARIYVIISFSASFAGVKSIRDIVVS